MAHIKRDGAWLCKGDIGEWAKLNKKYNSGEISFKDAHSYTSDQHEKHTCSECTKKYYEILDNLDEPIII